MFIVLVILIYSFANRFLFALVFFASACQCAVQTIGKNYGSVTAARRWYHIKINYTVNLQSHKNLHQNKMRLYSSAYIFTLSILYFKNNQQTLNSVLFML